MNGTESLQIGCFLVAAAFFVRGGLQIYVMPYLKRIAQAQEKLAGIQSEEYKVKP